MTGRIEKRGKSSYRIEISLPKKDGKYPKYRETMRGTKPEAQKRMRELLTELDERQKIIRTNLTMEELSKEWLESKTELEPGSIRFYRDMLNMYILKVFKEIPIKEITPRSVQILFNKHQNMQRQIKSTLSACLNYAVQMEYIKVNPASRVIVHSKPKEFKRSDFWTAEQVQAFLKVCRGEFYEAYFQIALRTGMRQEEILVITWDHIDGNQLTINQALKQKKPLVIGRAKTRSGHRTISIGNTLQAFLRSHKVKQNEHRLRYKRSYQDQGFIAANEYGGVLDSGNIRRAMQRIAAKAGLPYITPRNLRHTHATLLLEAGAPPNYVQERLGHERVDTTLNTYSFVTPNLDARFVEEFDELIK